MTIVVGYVPTPEGEAALTQAITEARKASTTLLVINSSKGDAPVDTRYAQEPEMQGIEGRLAAQGIDHVIKQPVRGHDAAAEVLDAAEEHKAEPDRDRPAPPDAGGQTDHGKHLPTDPAGG